jgi:hypothetical protein
MLNRSGENGHPRKLFVWVPLNWDPPGLCTLGS